MKRWWVSFYSADPSKWEYHGPWWVSGVRMSDDAQTVCAAVQAVSEDAAWAVIAAAHDEGHAPLEQRFCEERAADWEPFTDRFPKRHWMKWPWPM